MKKKLITLLLIAMTHPLMAQPPVDNLNKMLMNPQKVKPEILTDKTDAQNQRVIYGKAQIISNKEDEDQEKIPMSKPIPTAISTQAFYKSGTYGITINMVRIKKRNIPTGASVLIKTAQGTVIETIATEGSEPEETYHPLITIPNLTRPYDTPRYRMHCHIELDADMRATIRQEGIVKLRIQTGQDWYDIDLKKDNLSKFYAEEFAQIDEALKTVKGFRDDF